MNPIGYIRVSTDEQAERGYSLAAQESKIRAYAALHDLGEVEIVRDDGWSAKSLERPGLRALMDRVRNRAVRLLIVTKLDRLTRDVADWEYLRRVFEKTKTGLVSIGDALDTTRATGRLHTVITMGVSQWEREVIGERTREALATMRTRGRRISRHAPYGWEIDPDSAPSKRGRPGGLRECAPEQAIIAEVRGMTGSPRERARSLAASGVLRRTRLWTVAAVRKIILESTKNA